MERGKRRKIERKRIKRLRHLDKGQQEEKYAENEGRKEGTALYSCVRFLSNREKEREMVKEKKDKEAVSASSQTPGLGTSMDGRLRGQQP